MRIGTKEFDVEHKTYVMGILNVTPDSFSDGGKYVGRDAALKRAEQMIKEGADIVDVGGESTRPGYTAVSEAEEIARTVPVIEALRSRFDIPISIDTSKSRVALEAVRAGADLVNDVWGLKSDEKMARTIKEANVACCLMHNRKNADYADFMAEMRGDLEETLALAKDAEIPDDKIILDPGIGFGKTYEHNLEAIRRLKELKDLGYPILLGASKKSVIGLTLGVEPKERVTGTAVTTVFAVRAGAAFVRVHDVKENAQAIRMAEAILGGGKIYG